MVDVTTKVDQTTTKFSESETVSTAQTRPVVISTLSTDDSDVTLGDIDEIMTGDNAVSTIAQISAQNKDQWILKLLSKFVIVLTGSPQDMLSIPQEALDVHRLAGVLSSPLEARKNMYSDLQNKYCQVQII